MYLSQSLRRPRSATTNATSVPVAPQYSTDGRVESWVSQSNQSTVPLIPFDQSKYTSTVDESCKQSRRRRTKSSEELSVKSSSHQRWFS